jgi:hypothetical protein
MDAYENFVRFQHSRKDIDKEVPRRHPSGTTRAHDLDLCLQRHHLLTRKGRDVILVVQALAQVGDKWGITGDAGPPLKFINRNSGRQVKLALVDEKSAEVVRMREFGRKPAQAPTIW